MRLKSLYILIDCLKRQEAQARLPQSKKQKQNLVMATVEFSLDSTE